jgi:hypothetical protein
MSQLNVHEGTTRRDDAISPDVALTARNNTSNHNISASDMSASNMRRSKEYTKPAQQKPNVGTKLIAERRKKHSVAGFIPHNLQNPYKKHNFNSNTSGQPSTPEKTVPKVFVEKVVDQPL